MKRKKPSARVNTVAPLDVKTVASVACRSCETLERQYDDVINHIREMLATRFQSIGEKVRELRRWQERRDEAIELFYSHKRRHRTQIRVTQPITAA